MVETISRHRRRASRDERFTFARMACEFMMKREIIFAPSEAAATLRRLADGAASPQGRTPRIPRRWAIVLQGRSSPKSLL
jgi:hypothetical protein